MYLIKVLVLCWYNLKVVVSSNGGGCASRIRSPSIQARCCRGWSDFEPAVILETTDSSGCSLLGGEAGPEDANFRGFGDIESDQRLLAAGWGPSGREERQNFWACCSGGYSYVRSKWDHDLGYCGYIWSIGEDYRIVQERVSVRGQRLPGFDQVLLL
jgi:hypothetical protein